MLHLKAKFICWLSPKGWGVGLAEGFYLQHVTSAKKRKSPVPEDLPAFPRCMTIGELLLGEDNRKLGGPGYPQAGQTTAKDCWGPKGPAACTPRAAPTRLDPPQAQQSPELRSQRSSPEMSLPQEPTQAARVAEPHTQEPGSVSARRARGKRVCMALPWAG